MRIQTENPEIILTPLQENQIPLLQSYIMKMAVYEKLEEQVTSTEELLHHSIFEQNAAKVYIVEKSGEAIGFVLYTMMFSTFTGKPSIFLEDIYIDEDERGNGYGTLIFKELTKIAKENNYGRMDWQCLDWNQPSIEFYTKMGGVPLSDWITFRLDEEAMSAIREK